MVSGRSSNSVISLKTRKFSTPILKFLDIYFFINYYYWFKFFETLNYYSYHLFYLKTMGKAYMLFQDFLYWKFYPSDINLKIPLERYLNSYSYKKSSSRSFNTSIKTFVSFNLLGFSPLDSDIVLYTSFLYF